ncbi:MAG TPA: acyl carrier protein [Verrucomicrobiae bacterium]
MKQPINSLMNDLLTEQEIAGVQEILARELGVKPEQLTPEAVLDADLGADSLTKVEIIMALEERFQVTVPDELAERVQTVEDVYEALGKVLGR